MFSNFISFIAKRAPHKSTILDVGFGSGVLLKELIQNFPESNVFGIDVNESYFNHVNANIPQAKLEIYDLAIIATKDAVMVAHKASVQDTKVIVEQLKHENRNEWELNREVYRPWGKYDSIDSDDGYQVKRLTVNPGAKLSVQMHYHRSEHWVVVAGRARVHYGDNSHDLNVNESTYHGKEVVHALENLGDIPLQLIEVQVGSYLGEDDIVRFEDNYGRDIKKIK